MKLKPSDKITFRAKPMNAGPVTISSSDYPDAVTLHHADGRPLLAGEIAEGGEITFDRRTGKVIKE